MGHASSEEEEEDDDDWPAEEETDDGHSDADSLLNAMIDWLAKQDVPTLVSKLERLDG